MATRKRDVKKIVIDSDVEDEDPDKPSCLGQKCHYCRAELCGQKWFDLCPILMSEH